MGGSSTGRAGITNSDWKRETMSVETQWCKVRLLARPFWWIMFDLGAFYILVGLATAVLLVERDNHPVALILKSVGVILFWPLVLLEWWSQGE